MEGIIIILLYLYSTAFTDGCVLLRSTPMFCSEIRGILDYHNDQRNIIAGGNRYGLPKARNMYVLKYDHLLADLAQKSANACDSGVPPPPNTGVNTVALEEPDPIVGHINKLGYQWYREIDNYSWLNPALFSTGPIKHFKQFFWAKTMFLGCGLSFYKNNKGGNEFPFTTKLVCFYYPAADLRENALFPIRPYDPLDGNAKCDNTFVHKQWDCLCAHDLQHMLNRYDPCYSRSSSKLLPFPYLISIYSILIFLRRFMETKF